MHRVSENPSVLELLPSHWARMKDVLFSEWEYQKVQFSDELEFRFIPMPEQSYSALLSYKGIDVFHFIWTEVDGLIDITHRIVHPDFRGQGIATQMMQAIEERAQQLANAQQSPTHLMLETSQLSVVNLGKKCGMEVSAGSEALEHLEQYRVDENTNVLNKNGYKMNFRLSKRILPEKTSPLESARSLIRLDVLKVLAPAA
ncbi:MAG: GNAT family N-acetyltransferase [Candidatus Altimarinota bacterium]